MVVSIPPDAGRRVGEIQWPASRPADPATSFAVLDSRPLNAAGAAGWFHRTGRHRVLVYVHGFDTRHDEAVFLLAQLVHDSGTPFVPLLFSWPSRGSVWAYDDDKASTNWSRDALEDVLRRAAADPSVSDVTVLAHSMGSWLAVEALRQIAIRDGRVPAKTAALHRDVRRLRHALSRRSPDDLGHARLPVRPRQGGWSPPPIGMRASFSPTAAGYWCRSAIRRRAYATSRSMTWAHTADRYLEVFETVGRERLMKMFASRPPSLPARIGQPLSEIRLGHFQTMCDDTGIAQHAVRSVPDRAHGYCVDDNARALLLACALTNPGEPRLSDVQTGRFASFIQHAWNPDTGRFRNFMSYDRRWLEDRGSEDSHGRTLWALGEDARRDPDQARRQWAADLFARALASVEGFTSPRSWAFTLLGLDGYCAAESAAPDIVRLRRLLAERLMACLAVHETAERPWFEAGLTYDNARLCQALIVTGASAGHQTMDIGRTADPALVDDPAGGAERGLSAGRQRRVSATGGADPGLRPAPPGGPWCAPNPTSARATCPTSSTPAAPCVTTT